MKICSFTDKKCVSAFPVTYDFDPKIQSRFRVGKAGNVSAINWL